MLSIAQRAYLFNRDTETFPPGSLTSLLEKETMFEDGHGNLSRRQESVPAEVMCTAVSYLSRLGVLNAGVDDFNDKVTRLFSGVYEGAWILDADESTLMNLILMNTRVLGFLARTDQSSTRVSSSTGLVRS
ncbi:hypothetical protein [Arthrobacter citreus]|uniref:hypothetical protein n=1 Tax=Arthrobacter citreus TaxID=1670 RepID=UPI0036DBF141